MLKKYMKKYLKYVNGLAQVICAIYIVSDPSHSFRSHERVGGQRG